MGTSDRHCNCRLYVLNVDSLFSAFINWYRDLRLTSRPFVKWEGRVVTEEGAQGPPRGINFQLGNLLVDEDYSRINLLTAPKYTSLKVQNLVTCMQVTNV